VTIAAALAAAVAIGASATAVATDASYLLGGSDPLSRMDAYASAAGLSSLRSSDTKAIRIWANNYMFGEVTGFVVAEDSVSICAARTELHESIETIHSASCREVPNWKNLKALLSKIEELSRFDNMRVGCGVMDGTGYAVDGVLNGRRFSFESNNPQECSDEVSKAMVETLNLLPEDSDAP